MVALQRTALFETPLWMAQLDDVVPYHTEMAREVEEMIDNSDPEDPPRFLAHQTPRDPFTLGSQGWRILERLSNKMFSDLAKQHFQRWTAGEFHLRRWAIRFGRLDETDKARLERDAVHNHLPALFSAIYYLRIPGEFTEKPEGGTMFVNPLGNLMDVVSPRTNTIAPKEGRFLVFPSFVDHAPVPIRWTATTTPRIVVSCDVFYVSGEAIRTDPHSILKAEPDRG